MAPRTPGVRTITARGVPMREPVPSSSSVEVQRPEEVHDERRLAGRALWMLGVSVMVGVVVVAGMAAAAVAVRAAA